MNYDEGYPSDILPLMPHGTNSTLFTACCGTAICDDEPCCPQCGREVVGHDAETQAERDKIRWQNATRFWKR
jgi:predicted amidophosphoribosyltransferase